MQVESPACPPFINHISQVDAIQRQKILGVFDALFGPPTCRIMQIHARNYLFVPSSGSDLIPLVYTVRSNSRNCRHSSAQLVLRRPPPSSSRIAYISRDIRQSHSLAYMPVYTVLLWVLILKILLNLLPIIAFRVAPLFPFSLVSK